MYRMVAVPRLSMIFVGGWLLLLAGCIPNRSYEGRGRIVGFGDDGRTVLIEHEAIPGLMPAMVMPFKVAGTLDTLSTGDAVQFTLVLTRDSSWIEQLHQLPDSAVAAHPAGMTDPSFSATHATPLLQPGDPAPPFTLTDQDGARLTLTDYEGHYLLLTFIYTRCPLPDYCPRLSAQFQTLQPLLKDRYGDHVRLLSVSFDTAYDTPEVLHTYARRYTEDTNHWTFATGTDAEVAALAEPLGVFYAASGDQFDHNLATALIGPDGHLLHLWRGTDWHPDDVLHTLSRYWESENGK